MNASPGIRSRTPTLVLAPTLAPAPAPAPAPTPTLAPAPALALARPRAEPGSFVTMTAPREVRSMTSRATRRGIVHESGGRASAMPVRERPR